FPPGDTAWKKTRPQSAWREFGFVHSQIKRAIEPYLSLEEMIARWKVIQNYFLSLKEDVTISYQIIFK
ncbi:hypothetical protein D1AOALGA4SA_2889, partial [Olavius algarvensis Delta 1 endosymbiont]